MQIQDIEEHAGTSPTPFDLNASQFSTVPSSNKISINYTGKIQINFGRLTSKCKNLKNLNFELFRFSRFFKKT